MISHAYNKKSVRYRKKVNTDYCLTRQNPYSPPIFVTLFSGHTIKLENGLYNFDYNSRTVYTILINDTSKGTYENCLQGMSTIFFILSRISDYGSKFSPLFKKINFKIFGTNYRITKEILTGQKII